MIEPQEYVYVVNGKGSDFMPPNYKYVYVVNGMRSDDISGNCKYVSVINGTRSDFWPADYENVYIVNGMHSDMAPGNPEYVYVVNFDVLKSIPSVRRALFPSAKFITCPLCGNASENPTELRKDWFKCDQCGHVFSKSEADLLF